MIYPSADKLENWGSKYALVVLSAKRAKQIKGGAMPMINTDSRNPLTIALEEIAENKITCVVADVDIALVSAQEPEVAQLLAIPLRTGEEEEETLELIAEPSTSDEAATEEMEELEDLEELEEEEEEELAPSWISDEDTEGDHVEMEHEDESQPKLDDLHEDAAPKTRGKNKAEPDKELDDTDVHFEVPEDEDIDAEDHHDEEDKDHSEE